MANVAHSTLTGSNLHENKGVASASNNTVATASSGTTVWQKLTHSNLQTTGNPFGAQLLHVRDSAVLSLTANSWKTRPLNVSVTNEISSASLVSNQISLPAGTYFIDSICSGRLSQSSSAAAQSQTRLRNITSGTDILYSNVANTANNVSFNQEAGVSVTAYVPIVSSVKGRFTLAGTSTLELQTYSTGLLDSVEAVSGITIINSQVYIWKVA